MRAAAIVCTFAAVFFAQGSLFAQPGPTPFVVIVNPELPATSLDRKYLADIFLKKATFWPNGQVIKPVDLRPNTKARRSFSANVLNRPIASVRTYWQQRIFTGRGVPPPELNSDREVIAYVRDTPGAIGYISGATVPQGVEIVTVR